MIYIIYFVAGIFQWHFLIKSVSIILVSRAMENYGNFIAILIKKVEFVEILNVENFGIFLYEILSWHVGNEQILEKKSFIGISKKNFDHM